MDPASGEAISLRTVDGSSFAFFCNFFCGFAATGCFCFEAGTADAVVPGGACFGVAFRLLGDACRSERRTLCCRPDVLLLGAAARIGDAEGMQHDDQVEVRLSRGEEKGFLVALASVSPSSNTSFETQTSFRSKFGCDVGHIVHLLYGLRCSEAERGRCRSCSLPNSGGIDPVDGRLAGAEWELSGHHELTLVFTLSCRSEVFDRRTSRQPWHGFPGFKHGGAQRAGVWP